MSAAAIRGEVVDLVDAVASSEDTVVFNLELLEGDIGVVSSHTDGGGSHVVSRVNEW